MIKMNGINAAMIKQCMPTLLNMMKYRSQNGRQWGKHCGRGRRGRLWRHGRGGHRGRSGHHWRGEVDLGCGNWQQCQRQSLV